MAFIFGTALSAALITLACPHCHGEQVRARSHHGVQYRCKKCNRLFSREAGEKEMEEKKKKKDEKKR